MRTLTKSPRNSVGSHLRLQQPRPVVENGGHVWTVRPKRFLKYLLRPLVHQFRFRQFALDNKQWLV